MVANHNITDDDIKHMKLHTFIDNYYDFKNNKAFLRFQISPNGCVSELTYNDKGLKEYLITYPLLEDKYNLSYD